MKKTFKIIVMVEIVIALLLFLTWGILAAITFAAVENLTTINDLVGILGSGDSALLYIAISFILLIPVTVVTMHSSVHKQTMKSVINFSLFMFQIALTIATLIASSYFNNRFFVTLFNGGVGRFATDAEYASIFFVSFHAFVSLGLIFLNLLFTSKKEVKINAKMEMHKDNMKNENARTGSMTMDTRKSMSGQTMAHKKMKGSSKTPMKK